MQSLPINFKRKLSLLQTFENVKHLIRGAKESENGHLCSAHIEYKLISVSHILSISLTQFRAY